MFYGWKISALASYSNLLLQGGVLYTMNAFMEPLCRDNDWSRAGVNAGLGFAALMGQVAGPLVAGLSTRVHLRTMMTVGAALGGVSTILMGMTSNLLLFTMLFTVTWISTQACGGVVANALMSNWFTIYRGRAFGLANMGTSLSGAVLPFAIMLLIESFGLRSAYLYFGLVILMLMPLSWLIIHDNPEEMGLKPDGKVDAVTANDGKRQASNTTDTQKTTHKNAQGTTLAQAVQIGQAGLAEAATNAATPQAAQATTMPGPVPAPVERRKLYKDPNAYYIGFAFGLALLCTSGVMSQLKPRFTDAGFSDYFSMLLACIAALCAALTKFGWGWICDKTTPLTAARLVMLTSFLGFLPGFLPPGPTSTVLFSIGFGCAAGGLWTILPALVAYFFGNKDFLPCYKFISIFIIIRSAGFPILGFSHSYMGSYLGADIFFLLMFAAAFGLTLLLKEKNAAESRT